MSKWEDTTTSCLPSLQRKWVYQIRWGQDTLRQTLSKSRGVLENVELGTRKLNRR